MQRPLHVRIEGKTIYLRDFYVKALSYGFDVLLANSPESVIETYQFQIVH